MCRTRPALFSHSNSFQMCVYILYIVSTNNCITDKVNNLKAERLLTLSAMKSIYTDHATIFVYHSKYYNNLNNVLKLSIDTTRQSTLYPLYLI